MKKIVTFLFAALLTASLFAQVPERMTYQAVIRNPDGVLITNHDVSMRISILQGSVSGTAVYVETHATTTNVNGLFTIEIGGGTVVSGLFSAIDWSTGLYFIKTETDENGGTSYTITGTSQLLSVPYALYAKKAENVDALIQQVKDLQDFVYTQLPLPITDLTVSPGLLSLNVDSTYMLNVSIIPSNATNKTLIWSSSNSDIAIVDSLGMVRGIKPGTDTIKVTTKEGNISAICIVIVTKWMNYKNSQLSTGVNIIAIDEQGNKWFGTTGGGVSKFDGTNWTTYNSDNSSLLNNWVTAIAIDPLGNKWFGTVSGVSKFDGESWTNYNTTNSGLAYNQVNSIAIDGQGNKWFGTLDGISKFDDNNWTTFNTSNSSLADNYISYIAIDIQGNKWIATATGISKFDGINWTTYTSIILKSASNIAFDPQENIWIGTIGNGVSKFDGTNWTTYSTMNSMLPRNSVNAIAIDPQGNKWFGTDGGGVSRFDGTDWITFTKNDGLGWNYVYSVAIDKEGHKWFGYYNGVSKLIDH